MFAMRLGRIGSSVPLSRAYGFDRGQPIDRLYIEQFLAEHAADIRGHVLEIGEDLYSRRFGGDRITKQDVLHIHSSPEATIVGDLASRGTLPASAFDCIILTQTLQYVFDLKSAVEHIRDALKPGGVALVTVPASRPICADEWQDSHYWLFTSLSVGRLFESTFGAGKVEVAAFGNLYAATAYLHGAAVEEVSQAKLRDVMPEYAIVIAARAIA